MNIHSLVNETHIRATTEEGKSLKREAILDAALELFAERGFHGTAVPLIAESAGVAAGTVYRYFESKEAIVNALYQQHKRALGQRILGRLSPAQSPREQFHAYWSALAAFARESPRAFEFLELHHHAPYLDDASRSIESGLVEMARARFRELQAQRVIKSAPAEVLMAIVYGAFVGIFKACGEGTLVLSDEAVAIAEQCAWEAIRA